MTFMQIIDYETNRPDELQPLFDEWAAATEGKRTVSRDTHTQDRENPAHFVEIVEFPSYEAAMKNNDLPETQRIAAELQARCTKGPHFLNLDVIRDESM
ncbi:MAG TPA: hypothetical protein VIL71_24010 [Spirillospora sp.]